jgi:hypothetical protein
MCRPRSNVNRNRSFDQVGSISRIARSHARQGGRRRMHTEQLSAQKRACERRISTADWYFFVKRP